MVLLSLWRFYSVVFDNLLQESILMRIMWCIYSLVELSYIVWIEVIEFSEIVTFILVKSSLYRKTWWRKFDMESKKIHYHKKRNRIRFTKEITIQWFVWFDWSVDTSDLFEQYEFLPLDSFLFKAKLFLLHIA